MNVICQFFRRNYILANCEEAINKKAFTLNLSHFQMTEVPDIVERCESIQKLFLNQNILMNIPDGIGNLLRLQSLTLDYNKLTEFPMAISRLTNLRFLNLSCNQIDKLPPEIGYLTLLETFWCNNTGLLEIPLELHCCEKLETLGLRGNKIKTIPFILGELKELRWLTFDTNEITDIPVSLASLDKLVHFNMKSNRLTKIPAILISMVKLQFVFMNDNQIDELPANQLLSDLSFLRMLNLCGNPICSTPEMQAFAMQQMNLYVDVPKETESDAGNRNNIESIIGNLLDEDLDEHSSSDWANSVKTSDIDTTDESNLETNIEDISMMLPELSRFITNL